MCLFMDSLFCSIGLFAYPCPKATAIKIRLDIRLYKSSYFYSSSRLSWLFLALSIFIKIYTQPFLNLREGSKGRGCCITICWCIFSVKRVPSDLMTHQVCALYQQNDSGQKYRKLQTKRQLQFGGNASINNNIPGINTVSFLCLTQDKRCLHQTSPFLIGQNYIFTPISQFVMKWGHHDRLRLHLSWFTSQFFHDFA